MKRSKNLFGRHAGTCPFSGYRFFAALCLALSVHAAEGWRVSRAVTGEVTESRVVAVLLDPAVYAASKPDLSDIRIRTDAGADIPYVIRPDQTVKRETVLERHPMSLQSLEPQGDGLVIHVRFPGTNTFAVTSLELETPLTDFEQAVTLQTEAGEAIGGPQVIYDYSRYAKHRKVSVTVPKSVARGFKIVIGKADDELFDRHFSLEEATVPMPNGAEGVQRRKRYAVERRPFNLTRVVAVSPRTVPHLSPAPSRKVDVWVPFEKIQEGTYLLRTGRMPVTGLEVSILETNFQRPVTVEDDTGRVIARSTFKAVSLPGQRERDCRVTFSETRSETLTVAFGTGDNAPLSLKADAPFELEMRPYVLCFIAEPGVAYRLLTGNPAIKHPPVYEQPVNAYLDKGFEPVRWELAPDTDTSFEPTSIWLLSPFLKRHGFTLCAGLAVALLAWACILTLRKTASSGTR
ncbi:MAG: hypothetical protein J6334_12105 [Kiritimatiellae bacterium]|nr:hypothetical protein [Kiritimatiellia bacterium]